MSVGDGTSRRALLIGVVGAGAALVACGTESDEPAPGVAGTAGATPGQNTVAPAPDENPADGVPAAEIPIGGGRIYPDRQLVVTQPAAGQFRAFTAICPHEGCLVTSVSGGVIECACHGSQFRVGDGSVARGPSTRPLPARTATVDGDTVVIS